MATPSPAAAAQPKNRAGFVDLTSAISRGGCYCLNEQTSAPYTNLFIGDETLVLKSDADGKPNNNPFILIELHGHY